MIREVSSPGMERWCCCSKINFFGNSKTNRPFAMPAPSDRCVAKNNPACRQAGILFFNIPLLV